MKQATHTHTHTHQKEEEEERNKMQFPLHFIDTYHFWHEICNLFCYQTEILSIAN